MELVESLSAPLSLSRQGREQNCMGADVHLLKIWREESLSRGHPHLGWCIQLSINLFEGKHHQIRRLAKRAGYSHVLSLKRVRIAGILSIESIPNPGDCRWLSPEECNHLTKLFLTEDPAKKRLLV